MLSFQSFRPSHLQNRRRAARPEGLELLLKLGDERRLVVLLQAQLLLDALELLHQKVAPLVARDLLLHLLPDVRLQSGDIFVGLQWFEACSPNRKVRLTLLSVFPVR